VGQLDAARAHVVDVGLGAGVAVLEGALPLGLAPGDPVVALGVERRVDINEVAFALEVRNRSQQLTALPRP